MIVVPFHLFAPYATSQFTQRPNHAYLAVDFFFFALSGFVIGYAYDDRWNKMSITDYIKRRLVRLHPMVNMGMIIGAILFYIPDCYVYNFVRGSPLWQMLLIFVTSCMLFPTPKTWDIRGENEIFPLNGPTWTLMYEYIANILYALLIRRFPKAVLMLFVAD